MRFTESHEWVSVEGKLGTVGITSYAQGELGEIVFVAFPKVGQELKAGEEACVLESTKAAADVYTPVSGTIVAINEALRANPSLLNSQPETHGWLFQIELSNLKELEDLLVSAKYRELIS